MFSLPIPVLLTVTILANWLYSLLSGYFPKKVASGARALWFFNLVRNLCCGVTILVILLCSGGLGAWSLFSVLLGLLMGLANVWGMAANMKAFAVGPFSYTTVIFSLSAVIPALSGLCFGETVSPVQWCGILLMIVCLVLSPEQQSGAARKPKANAGWLILCLTAAALNGLTGVVQKLHQSLLHLMRQV